MVEIKEAFRIRLDKALALRDMKPVDLANRTGISESTISQYRSGYSKPKRDRLVLLANALGVSPSWLMGLEVPMSETNHSSKGVRIPVLGRVAAGIPIEEIEDVIDEEEIYLIQIYCEN